MGLLNILLVVDPNVVKGEGGHQSLLDVVGDYGDFANTGVVSGNLNTLFIEPVSNITDHDDKWVAAQLQLQGSQLCVLIRAVNAELRLLWRDLAGKR